MGQPLDDIILGSSYIIGWSSKGCKKTSR